MNKEIGLVVFHLHDQRYALHLPDVERVLHSVEINPLPIAPNFVSGTINYHGDFLPVINMRELFMHPKRDVELSDRFIIVLTKKMKLILWVDYVDDIISIPEHEISGTTKVFIENKNIKGIVKLNNDMVLINDIDNFLTTEQIANLKIAIKEEANKMAKNE